MIELIRPFGFHTYFDLYELLLQSQLAGEKAVFLYIPSASKIDGLTLEVEYIKARALDEIYQAVDKFDRLPTLRRMIHELNNIKPKTPTDD